MAGSGAQAAISLCLKSGDFSDLKIRCDPAHEFRIHRVVVCPQSDYIDKAVRDKRFQEGETGVIELPVEDDPEAVRATISFMYCGDYEAPGQQYLPTQEAGAPRPHSKKSGSKAAKIASCTNCGGGEFCKVGYFQYCDTCGVQTASVPAPTARTSTSPAPYQPAHGECHPMLFHLAVFANADRLQLTALKSLALLKFEELATTYWQTEEFVKAIEVMYQITPSTSEGQTARQIVIRVAAEHATELFQQSSFADMMEGLADFGKDLSAALCGHRSLNYSAVSLSGESLKCPVCSFVFSATIPSHLLYLTCPSCTSNSALGEWRL